jgi:hypothetical protein
VFGDLADIGRRQQPAKQRNPRAVFALVPKGGRRSIIEWSSTMFALLFFAIAGAVVSVTLTYSYGFAIAFLSTVLTASAFTMLGAVLIYFRPQPKPGRSAFAHRLRFHL